MIGQFLLMNNVEWEKFVAKFGLQVILVMQGLMNRNSSMNFKQNINQYQKQDSCMVFVSKQLTIVMIILTQIHISKTQKWTGVIIAQLSIHQKLYLKLRSEKKRVRVFLFESLQKYSHNFKNNLYFIHLKSRIFIWSIINKS